VDDRGVQAAFGELLQEPLADHRRTVHDDRRVIGLEGRERGRDQRFGQMRDADPDQAGLAACRHADPGHSVVQLGQQTASVVQQFHAGFGELHGAPGPPEQLHLQLAFHPRDGLRQAGLGDVQPGGGAPEMELLGHHGEVPQVAELDVRGPGRRLLAGRAEGALCRTSRLGSARRAGGHLALPLLQAMQPDVRRYDPLISRAPASIGVTDPPRFTFRP
jgi:hypothetical protein